MWLPEELERIYMKAYKGLEDQKIEDVLPPDDIQAIREAGTAIENIGNRIFVPKVNSYIDWNQSISCTKFNCTFRYLHQEQLFDLRLC